MPDMRVGPICIVVDLSIPASEYSIEMTASPVRTRGSRPITLTSCLVRSIRISETIYKLSHLTGLELNNDRKGKVPSDVIGLL